VSAVQPGSCGACGRRLPDRAPRRPVRRGVCPIVPAPAPAVRSRFLRAVCL